MAKELGRYLDSGHESSEDDEDVVSPPLTPSRPEIPPLRQEVSHLRWETSPLMQEMPLTSSVMPQSSRTLSPSSREIPTNPDIQSQRYPTGDPVPRDIFDHQLPRSSPDKQAITSAELSYRGDAGYPATSSLRQHHQQLPVDDPLRKSQIDSVSSDNSRTNLPLTNVMSPRRQHNTGFLVNTTENTVNVSREKTAPESIRIPVSPRLNASVSDSDDSLELESEEDSEEEELEEGEVDYKRYEKTLKTDDSDQSGESDYDDAPSPGDLDGDSEGSNSERVAGKQKLSRLSRTMPEIHEPENDTLSPLDQRWQTHRINSAPLSEPLNRTADTMSERSFMSTSLLASITTKAAKMKSYLTGGLRTTGSLLGTEELEKYFPDRQLSVFMSTWNMHEEKVLPRNLEDLLLPDDADYVSDLYVIGLQEATPFRAEWEVKIQEILGPTHVQLHATMFGVLHLAIYIRREYIWFCSPVEEDTIATRPGSMFKTKGAIGLSFNFFGSSFLFITSHFTSGDEELAERIEDFKKIRQGLQLPKVVPLMYPYKAKQDDVTSRFDFVFWSGDMNFRLKEDYKKVKKLISGMRQDDDSPDFSELLRHDQLSECMSKGDIFEGFREQEIQFFPTYKFDLNSDTYDTSSKERIPSYTDRILCKSRKEHDIQLEQYNSCSSIKISDHRPVYATFKVKIRPGKDGMPVAGGMFNRNVYLEGYKRRAAATRQKTQKSSSVCSLQ